MKRIHLLIPALLVIALAGGCTIRGGFHARSTAPSMVLVSPGVYVIEDYNEPVFYSEGAYWRYHSGIWYSSRVHTGGWVRVRTVPTYVSRIDRPHTYVHYRGSARGNARGNARYDRPGVRDHRDNRVEHRDNRGGYQRPAARDHRDQGNNNARPRGQTNNGGGVRVKTDTKVKVKVRGETNNPGKVKVRDHR
jgi:hypothetical protein